MPWPCETRTSTWRSFATISSGLYRFLATVVLLDIKDIPLVGPLQWGRITLSLGQKTCQSPPLVIRELKRDSVAALMFRPLQVQRWTRIILRSPIPDRGLVKVPVITVQLGRRAPDAVVLSLPSVPHQR